MLSFHFWTVNDRSCHSGPEQKTMSKAINLLFTEPINCAKNPIFRFEMVGVVLCWNSVAVDSYFIYSVLITCYCVNIVSVTSASLYLTSASRYNPGD